MVELNERHYTPITPPIVEREGKRLAVICLSDIDGTVTNELEPEATRITTIGPAKEAIAELEDKGIPVGLITARALGEAFTYQEALDSHGFTICEDGAVVVLPPGTLGASDREKILAKFGQERLQQLHQRDVVVLSEITTDALKDILSGIPGIVSSVTSSPEEIYRVIAHPSLEAAQISCERLASCYVAKPTAEQIHEINKRIAERGLPIRTFGWDPVSLAPQHLFGKDAHKGDALRLLNENIQTFLPHVGKLHGILPVVFGNNSNDLNLFEIAESMNGIGVLVGKPGGGYFVEEAEIPQTVIKSIYPAGEGLKAALPQVFARLNL